MSRRRDGTISLAMRSTCSATVWVRGRRSVATRRSTGRPATMMRSVARAATAMARNESIAADDSDLGRSFSGMFGAVVVGTGPRARACASACCEARATSTPPGNDTVSSGAVRVLVDDVLRRGPALRGQ